MDSIAFASSGLRSLLLVAGLLIPGAALARALRLPATLGLSFVGSAVLLYTSALTLDFLGVPLSLGTFVAAVGVATALALLAARRARAANTGDDDPPWYAPFTRLGTLTPVFVLFWLVVAFLLVREPLAGPDTGFRWAFLPEQWLRHGNLDFYPPVSANDFRSFFWAESIPPGIASLHAWAFACGGSFAPAWVVPVTALQFLALHDLAWRTGHGLGGDAAARATAALMAACPLLVWAARLGQETGLTAIAALGLAFALTSYRAAPRAGWAAAAGIFAALGAISREYGLVFPLLAAGALALLRARRTDWVAFTVAAAPLALAWPVHCALRTGNPFYSLDVAGLFPVNPVFRTWIADNAAVWSHVFADGGWRDALRWLALAAAPAVGGWVALGLAARRRRDAVLALAAVAVLIALWLASIPYTVGGPFYSLRVTSPALALGAVASGVALTQVRPVFLGALVVVTLPFTLLLPRSPLREPLHNWPAPWRAAPPRSAAAPEEIVAAILARHPTVVVTDSPGFQKLLAPSGVTAVPFWSPQVAWLFDPRTTEAEAARHWEASGMGVLVLSRYEPAVAFVNRRARWTTPPFAIRPVAESAGFVVFSVVVTKQ